MDAYIELQLLPDPEFPARMLMNTLFAKLHRGLVSYGAGDIGVSFPEHGNTGLGTRLRLHGSASALASLQAQNWLQGMRDHCQIGAISQAPTTAPQRLVRRVQAKSSPERVQCRLLKRRLARGDTPEVASAALAHVPAQKLLKLPYLVLNSHSTGQQFRLFIEHGPLQPQAQSGPFSAYGLSHSATVPWF